MRLHQPAHHSIVDKGGSREPPVLFVIETFVKISPASDGFVREGCDMSCIVDIAEDENEILYLNEILMYVIKRHT